jgi:hypothetical protein
MPTSHRIGYTAVTENGEIPMQVLLQAEELCRNSAQTNLQPKWLYRCERFTAV